MNIGERVTLGSYGGEAMGWLVIAEENGRYLLLNEQVVDYRPYHPVDISEGMGAKSYDETDWSSCELRAWLNGEFADAAFSPEELAHIPETEVAYNTIYKTLHSFFQGSDKCRDRIFLLSKAEVERYLPDENDRIARLTDFARTRAQEVSPLRNYGSWWLRTTIRQGYGAHCLYVYNFVREERLVGAILSSMGACVWAKDLGVRPAMWYVP